MPRWNKLRAPQLALVAALLAFALAPADAQERPSGITTPQVLPPFDPAAPACAAPPGLERAIGFAQDNRRMFIAGVGYGLQRAARDRGLRFEARVADNDAARQIADIAYFRNARFGAIVTAPVDAAGLAPELQQQIWAGGFVGTVVPPPAITILNAPQYLTGKVLADAAVAYIREKLGGTADVVLLTHDSLQFLAPRFTAMRDALKDMPGVTIVADISPPTVNEEGGYSTMKTILEAHPDVDVVLGADTVVLGALRALREAGKARPGQFLGGIDGEPEAVAEISAGNGPYKASVALSSPVFGYALGSLGADWLEGRSVPQAMDVLPIALTSDNLASYEADQRDPGAVYAEPSRRNTYLRMYGNICYDTRDRYLNFPWSSEAN